MNNMIDYDVKEMMTKKRCVIYKEIDFELGLLTQALNDKDDLKTREIKERLSALVERLTHDE